MKVKDAMHNGAEWVTPEITVAEMARKMKDLDIGALPVGENDRLIGMVTDRDITCRAVSDGKNSLTLTAREVMSKGSRHLYRYGRGRRCSPHNGKKPGSPSAGD